MSTSVDFGRQEVPRPRVGRNDPFSARVPKRLLRLRARAVDPPKVIVERAIQRLHRRTTREALAAGNTHSATTNALAIQITNIMSIIVPVVIVIVFVTIRKLHARPRGPLFGVSGVRRRHTVRGRLLLWGSLGVSNGFGFQVPSSDRRGAASCERAVLSLSLLACSRPGSAFRDVSQLGRTAYSIQSQYHGGG